MEQQGFSLAEFKQVWQETPGDSRCAVQGQEQNSEILMEPSQLGKFRDSRCFTPQTGKMWRKPYPGLPHQTGESVENLTRKLFYFFFPLPNLPIFSVRVKPLTLWIGFLCLLTWLKAFCGGKQPGKSCESIPVIPLCRSGRSPHTRERGKRGRKKTEKWEKGQEGNEGWKGKGKEEAEGRKEKKRQEGGRQGRRVLRAVPLPDTAESTERRGSRLSLRPSPTPLPHIPFPAQAGGADSPMLPSTATFLMRPSGLLRLGGVAMEASGGAWGGTRRGLRGRETRTRARRLQIWRAPPSNLAGAAADVTGSRPQRSAERIDGARSCSRCQRGGTKGTGQGDKGTPRSPNAFKTPPGMAWHWHERCL